jgi:hypothetical protein
LLALQANVMRLQIKEMDLEQRPWVSANSVTVEPLSYDVSGLRITLSFQLANSGHKPALDVWATMKAFPGYPEQKSLRESAEIGLAICNLHHEPSVALFPGDHLPYTMTTYVSDAEVKNSSFMPRATGKMVLPAVIACVVYKDLAGDEHHTAYQFRIMSFKDGHYGTIPMDDPAALPKLPITIELDPYMSLEPN